MKDFSIPKFLLVLLLFMGSVVTSAQDETTTYYFIRHAEKDRSDKTNKDPHLIDKGQLRALSWSIVLKDIDLDAIYSTNYNRTKETAAPTAQSKDLEVQLYDPRDMYNEAFINVTAGKTVLVVGHSNTTPSFVNKVLGEGEERYENIDDSNNGNLYIVTRIGEQKTVKLLHFN